MHNQFTIPQAIQLAEFCFDAFYGEGGFKQICTQAKDSSEAYNNLTTAILETGKLRRSMGQTSKPEATDNAIEEDGTLARDTKLTHLQQFASISDPLARGKFYSKYENAITADFTQRVK